VPFVLYSEPTGVFGEGASITKMAEEAHRRYAEIMRDVELMIDDHSTCCCPDIDPRIKWWKPKGETDAMR
jgi:hypothetical protein